MTVTVSATESDNMADTLSANIGNSAKLKLHNVSDTVLATLTYAASAGVVGVTSGAASITWAEGSWTDDETPANAGTCTYATLTTSADTEVIRFTDPTTELGLTSTSIQTDQPVRVTTDVVVKLPNST